MAGRAAWLAADRHRRRGPRVPRRLRRGGSGRRVSPASRPRRPRHGAADRRGDRPRRFVKLAGAVCLVTGASAGIGRATVDALAARGAHVVAVARDAERLAGVGERQVVWDLAEPAGLADEIGPVDVLVNNAGFGWAGPVAETP